jgi:hypothetical protein
MKRLALILALTAALAGGTTATAATDGSTDLASWGTLAQPADASWGTIVQPADASWGTLAVVAP